MKSAGPTDIMFTADRFNPAALAFPVEMNSVMDVAASRVYHPPVLGRLTRSLPVILNKLVYRLQHANTRADSRQTHLRRLRGRATVNSGLGDRLQPDTHRVHHRPEAAAQCTQRADAASSPKPFHRRKVRAAERALGGSRASAIVLGLELIVGANGECLSTISASPALG
jgi:hypothetical protein